MPSAATTSSSERLSATSLPVIVRLCTEPTERLVATPSILTTRSPPSTASVIRCCAAPGCCAPTKIVHGELEAAALNEAPPVVESDAGASSTEAALAELASLDVAGGDGPLPGIAAGSRLGSVALSGVGPSSDDVVSKPADEPSVALWTLPPPLAAAAPAAPASWEPSVVPAGAAATAPSVASPTETVEASAAPTATVLLVAVAVSFTVDSDVVGASASVVVGAGVSVETTALSSTPADSTTAAGDAATAVAQMSAAPAAEMAPGASGAARAAASAFSGAPATACASEPPPATPAGAPAEMLSTPA